VVHYGSYVPLRRLPGVSNILFFVNLAPWDPGVGSRTLRNRALRLLFETTVGRADLIIVQSAATLDFLRERYPNLSVRIVTVRNGCSTPELMRTVSPRDFVAVGDVYRHRRLECVVRAYGALPPGIREAHRLLVIGHLGRDEEAASLIRQEINRLQLNACVQLLGPLPREEVLRVVVDACAFVSFAAVENGPNAVSEAVALDVPMILSDIPVHRELADGRARYAADVAELTDALVAATSSVAEKVGRRAAVDTWDRHISELGAQLRQLGSLP
jgi:glycosyltransferase involved in cell wall biosynthesis